MTAKELERQIIANGWIYKDTRGSHKHFIHPTIPGKITIPQHKGDINIRTANTILEMAGIKTCSN